MPTASSRSVLSRRTLALAAALLACSPAWAQPGGAASSREKSVAIEPYTGPPIFLPEGEAPPPPTEVESRVVKENFPGTETTRFERRVVRYSDDSLLSDGPHKEFYSNGQLYVEGAFSLGKATGEWTYHHPNGEVAKTVRYAEGRPDGEVTVYSDQGKVIAKRAYAAGRRDGAWETYTPDGEQMVREDHYAGGKANGLFRIWYTNGQLRQELTFVEGMRDGVATEYTRVGDKRAEVNFKAGKKHGKTTVWRADGSTVEQTFEEGRLVSRDG